MSHAGLIQTTREPSAPAPEHVACVAERATDAFLAALRDGEPNAVETLVRTETPRLLSLARRILRDEESARDAVQDAFLQAFRSLPGFNGASSVSTWLYRIAMNAALMKLRARRRRPETSIEDLMPQFLEDGHHAQCAQPWLAADELLGQLEVRRLVQKCIDRLPEIYRTVLLLRDVEELDTQETARALGVSCAAVKVRLHRARLALRTLLEPVLRRPAPRVSRTRFSA